MDDKNTIGVTPRVAGVLEELVQEGVFQDQIDAAKFAMAVAIRSGVGSGEAVGTVTKWNIGSFDRDGELRVIVSALFPQCEAPYRLVEFLIDKGIDTLQDERKTNPHLDVVQLLQRWE